MLNVKTPDEVLAIIETEFDLAGKGPEKVSLYDAEGRVLAEDIRAAAYVPDFNRSAMDGFAVCAADTFGCSDAMPAILTLAGEVRMGEDAKMRVAAGTCAAVPTGGAIPDGADAVVMVEYTEDYGDGTVGILKPAAPGSNVVFRGDDVYPGKAVLPRGRKLNPQDVGALAAMGVAEVPVAPKCLAGIISTGDELVPADREPGPGQVRDVNSAMLAAALKGFGAEVKNYGVVRDSEALLQSAVEKAVSECDMVLVSGGSSVGMKDATCRVIESQGRLLLHGIAMKPGKPTILGKVGEKPVVGLPGHPVAAFFVTHLFVRPLLARLTGRKLAGWQVSAELAETVGANHGRAQYNGVFLEKQGGRILAHPIRNKSGLITSLAGSDGYFCIPRDCEGLPAGAEIRVTLYSVD
jgi:molybdopterin molybdotransferase